MATLVTEARAYRARILERDTATSQQLVRAYGRVVRRIDGELGRVVARIQAARAAGEPVTPVMLYQEGRLQRLREQALGELARFGERAQAIIGAATTVASGLGHEGALRLVDAATPPTVSPTVVSLPTATVEAATAHFRTTALAGLAGSFGAQGAAALEEAIVSGVALGKHPSVIAREVRQQLGTSLVRALTISRTEVMRAHREAALATYADNAAVVRGWTWIAGLGPRTCASCWAQHGSVHPIDEPMDTHPRCRCVAAPKTATWAELGFRGPEPPPISTGAELFAGSVERVQSAVLGPSKLAAYRSGQVSLEDFVARRQNPPRPGRTDNH